MSSEIPQTSARVSSWVLSSFIKRLIFWGLLAYAVLSSLLMYSALLPTWTLYIHGGPLKFDGWSDYALMMKRMLCGENVDMAGYISSYDHSFTPLFPFVLAVMDLVFNNMPLSMISINIIFSISSVFIIKKIVKEHFNVDDNGSLLILSLYLVNTVISLDFIGGSPRIQWSIFASPWDFI